MPQLPEQRIQVLLDGVSALRAIAAARRAALPPPENENPPRLDAVRVVERLADRLEMEVWLDSDGDRAATIALTDLFMSEMGAEDADAYEALANDTGWGTPYREGPPPSADARALLELAALARRYAAGEFSPSE